MEFRSTVFLAVILLISLFYLGDPQYDFEPLPLTYLDQGYEAPSDLKETQPAPVTRPLAAENKLLRKGEM